VRTCIIEDEALAAMDLEACLHKLDMNVVGVAATEDDAVRMAIDLAPELITADIRLRDGNGLRAVERIRQALPGVAVIYVTASNLEARAEDLPVIVRKPFNVGELQRAIAAARARVAHLRPPPSIPF
jgi:CheY-like chemotaxis protein